MKERPILFKSEMVRAILDGSKTQTRRVVNPQFDVDAEPEEMCATTPEGWQCAGHSGRWWDACEGSSDKAVTCSYGQPGDRLWVRESWDFLPDSSDRAMIVYWADGNAEERDVPDGFNPMIYNHERVRPSIHMPRWASRITLEIVSVRVERLQDITESDALAEGCKPIPGCKWRTFEEADAGIPMHDHTALDAFEALWESINGEGSWDANPWVWVVEFKSVEVVA